MEPPGCARRGAVGKCGIAEFPGADPPGVPGWAPGGPTVNGGADVRSFCEGAAGGRAWARERVFDCARGPGGAGRAGRETRNRFCAGSREKRKRVKAGFRADL